MADETPEQRMARLMGGGGIATDESPEDRMARLMGGAARKKIVAPEDFGPERRDEGYVEADRPLPERTFAQPTLEEVAASYGIKRFDDPTLVTTGGYRTPEEYYFGEIKARLPREKQLEIEKEQERLRAEAIEREGGSAALAPLEGVLSRAGQYPFLAPTALMRAFTGEPITSEDREMAARESAKMTERLGGPAAEETLRQRAMVAAKHPNLYSIGQSAIDLAAMMASGRATGALGEAAVPGMSLSPTAHAAFTGATTGALLNPTDPERGGGLGALFLGSAAGVGAALKGASENAFRLVTSEAGGGTVGSVLSQLAADGNVDPVKTLVDTGLFAAGGAVGLSNDAARANVETAAREGRTVSEMLLDAQRLREASGRVEIPRETSVFEKKSPLLSEPERVVKAGKNKGTVVEGLQESFAARGPTAENVSSPRPLGPEGEPGGEAPKDTGNFDPGIEPTDPLWSSLRDLDASQAAGGPRSPFEAAGGPPERPRGFPPVEERVYRPEAPAAPVEPAAEPAKETALTSGYGEAPTGVPKVKPGKPGEAVPEDALIPTETPTDVREAPGADYGQAPRRQRPDLSQAGFIDPRAIGDVVQGLGRAARATKEWWEGFGLKNVGRASREGYEAMAEGSTVDNKARHQAFLLADHVLRPFVAGLSPKMAESLGNRLQMTFTEAQLRSRGGSMRGKNAEYDATFPTEADQQRFRQSPLYKRFAKAANYAHNRGVMPWNIEGGNLGPERLKQRGVWEGEFSNMAPLTADDVKAMEGSGQGKFVSSGPSGRAKIARSAVAREFTGHADAYDWRLQAQYERGLRLSGRAVFAKRTLNALLRDGAIIPVTEDASRPEGWVDWEPRIDPEVRSPVAGRKFYVKPEIKGELDDWFGQSRLNPSEGLGAKAGKAFVAAATAGLPEAVGHGTNLIAVASRLGSPTLATHLASFMRPTADGAVARARAQIRLSEIGASKMPYDKTGIRKILSPASSALDAFDLAVRSSVLDAAEARVARGEAPRSMQYLREEVLKAGNYNKMTQDVGTRVIKAFFNPFFVAGKTAFSGAFGAVHRALGQPLTPDLPMKTRLLQAGRILTLTGGYLTLAGMHNKKVTGEWFPQDVPLGMWVGDVDPKTGTRKVSWGPGNLGRALGVQQMLKYTGIQAAVDNFRRGGPVTRGALRAARDVGGKMDNAMFGGPLMRAAGDAGLIPGGFKEATETNFGEAMGKAAPLYKFLIDLALGRIDTSDKATEILTGEKTEAHALSPGSLNRAVGR